MRLLIAICGCFFSTSALAALCNPTDLAENAKWCVQQPGNGLCRCIRLNDPNCAVGAFMDCEQGDDRQKIRDNARDCENQQPGLTLKKSKDFFALCVE